MVQVKVEHVIVVLLGLFLLYHFMGSCGCNRVEGWLTSPDQYMYQKPYILVDGSGQTKYCGLSTRFESYYNDLVDPEKYPKDLKDQKAIYDRAKDTYQGWVQQVNDQKDVVKTKRNAIQTVKDTNPGDDDGSPGWNRKKTNYDADLREANDAYGAANDELRGLEQEKSTAKKVLDDIETSYQDSLQEYMQPIQEDYNNKQRLCDKPNRMLYRMGPQHACNNKVSLIKGPDRTEFWDKEAVKSLMRSGPSGGKFNTCEVITDDADTLMGAKQPFHGYSATGQLANYEESGPPFPDLTDV